MKSAYKGLTINSLCYRDRFVKQFPLFVAELKELGLYDQFMSTDALNDKLLSKDFYALSLEYKNLYKKYHKIQVSRLKQHAIHSQSILHYTFKNKLRVNTLNRKSNVKWNFKVDGLFGDTEKSEVLSNEVASEGNVKYSQKIFEVTDESERFFEETHKKKNSDKRAEDLIIRDKIYEEENENFLKAYGLKDYNQVEYNAAEEYSFHESDATIFARKKRKEEKKERKKARALRKQERLLEEEKKQKELAKKPKNPSFYDLLNIPLELRTAKYDIPLPSEEEEEEDVIEYTPIDWDAEDLKYLIIVPHIRDIKLFDGSIGFSFGIYTGNKLLPIAVTEPRVGSYLGSFIFTKRITREIHAKKKKGMKKGQR